MISASTYSVRRTFIEVDDAVREVPARGRFNTWDGSISLLCQESCDDQQSEATTYDVAADEDLSCSSLSETSSAVGDSNSPNLAPRSTPRWADSLSDTSADDTPTAETLDALDTDLRFDGLAQACEPCEPPMCRFGSDCFSRRCRFAHPDPDKDTRCRVSREAKAIPSQRVEANVVKKHRARRQRGSRAREATPEQTPCVNTHCYGQPVAGMQYFIVLPYVPFVSSA